MISVILKKWEIYTSKLLMKLFTIIVMIQLIAISASVLNNNLMKIASKEYGTDI